MGLESYDFDILSEQHDISEFDCDDADINEFLKDDAFNYQEQKMANTYVFYNGDNKVVAFFSILNDCLNDKGYENGVWNKFHRKRIPNAKRIRQYPAVKVGRLGVDKSLQGSGLAYELMDFIKGYSISELKPACRLLLLDAYNKEKQLKYYQSNNFEFLDSSTTGDLTRLMFYDLMQLS
ncbi:MAG: GNAT family N-acetyltransferase [Flavobacteriales bacterium]|nr:GNAT family N-acetyltransferase [Flavobacteriales bacterium]